MGLSRANYELITSTSYAVKLTNKLRSRDKHINGNWRTKNKGLSVNVVVNENVFIELVKGYYIGQPSDQCSFYELTSGYWDFLKALKKES
jgi:hypothetical protein